MKWTKEDYIKKLEEYERTIGSVKPFFDENIAVELFTAMDSSSSKEDRLKLIRERLPEEDEAVIDDYIADIYYECLDIIGCLSGMYDTPYLPHTDEAQSMCQRVINVCCRIYPWLPLKTIEHLISKSMWLSNR